MNANLLVIAYAFPPENIVGAARPFRFFRYLPQFGISPHVITASQQEHPPPGVHFVRDTPRDFPRQTWSWQIERLLRKFLCPGETGLIWSRAAALAAREILPSNGAAAILSTSPPIGGHLAALQIRRRLGVPWIADFRDPMVSNPSDAGAVARASVYATIESLFFHYADAVVANTDAALNFWRQRYPGLQNKFHLIWNGFDPAEAVTARPIPQREYKHIAHLGSLYGGRDPGILLDALERLLARGAIDPACFRVSLIGPSVDSAISNPGAMRRLMHLGAVEHSPSLIPQREARRIALEADALLVLQPQSDLQVPGKLFEYIRIGRPILALIQRDSPADRILRASRIPHRALYPDDPPAQIDAKLLDFIQQLPNEAVRPSEWFDQQFNAERQTQTLSALIHSLLSRRRATDLVSG